MYLYNNMPQAHLLLVRAGGRGGSKTCLVCPRCRAHPGLTRCFAPRPETLLLFFGLGFVLAAVVADADGGRARGSIVRASCERCQDASVALGETRKRMTSIFYFDPSRRFPQACFSLPCFCRATFPAPCAWWYALLFWLLPRGLGCGGSGGLKHRGRGGTARLVPIFARVSVSLGNTGK